jgi:bifunctional non-homologous end joining protein LigD
MNMHQVHGRRVVVTGKIDGHSRATAEAALRDAGAIVQRAVTTETDVLVTGLRVGPTKLNKASALGVEIIPWEQLLNGATTSRTPRPPAPPRTAPRTVAPMLAKAGDLPTGPEWLYEIKWDGFRGVATCQRGSVTLQSRSAKSDLTVAFPAIAEDLAEVLADVDCILDGELVVLDVHGNSSFQGLTGSGRMGPSYVVFDVLEWDGVDTRDWPLEARRELLHEQIESRPFQTVAISPAFDDGAALLAWAEDQGIEGVVAKKRQSTYREGKRLDVWTKVKLRHVQEFAVVGWLAGEGTRAGAAGSLLLAVYEDGGWQYVGRVGTGQELDFWRTVTKLAAGDRVIPADQPIPRRMAREARWVTPQLVVQVEFQRWTEDGSLWHPSVVGVRTDKQPHDCTRSA